MFPIDDAVMIVATVVLIATSKKKNRQTDKILEKSLCYLGMLWYNFIKKMQGGGYLMTTAAKNKRWQAVKLADALNAIEGVPVSSYAKTLSHCWANGEITGEQMKAALLASHRKMAEAEAQAHG